jgi:GMP reductase
MERAKSEMRIEDGHRFDFDSVMIKPKRSRLKSRGDVDLVREYKFVNSTNTWSGIPIMAANMDGVGTFEMAKELWYFAMPTVIRKHYSIKEWTEKMTWETFNPEYVIPSIGANDKDLDKFYELQQMYAFRFVCIDVANGYGEWFPDFIHRVRGDNPTLTIIAGNVATYEMTEQLILSGADIVKVGIGGGSVCTTRLQTGVGIPQLSAVIECADAAHGLGGHIISDGGCRHPDDIAKAFGGGADFVMLGGMLAGHWEGLERGAETIGYGKEAIVKFYGMSSKTANDKHNGGLKDYRSAEGKEVEIPYRGKVKDTIQDILGGLRGACTMIGAERIKDFSKRTTFIPVHSRIVNDIFGD